MVLFVFGIFFSDHPVFLVFLFIGVIVIVILSSQFINVLDVALENPGFDDKVDDFTLSGLLIGPQFPIIILGAGVLVIFIIMSVRSRGGVA